MSEFEIYVDTRAPAAFSTHLLVLPLFEDALEPQRDAAQLDAGLGGLMGRVLGRGDFRGRKDEALLLVHPGEGPDRILLAGVGKRADYTLERLRRAVGIAVRQAEGVGARELAIALDEVVGEGPASSDAAATARAAAEAAVLASWTFRELKTMPDEDNGSRQPVSLTLVTSAAGRADAFRGGAAVGRAAGRAANLARDLAMRPGNVATPRHLAEVASDIAAAPGFELTVLDREGIRKASLAALLAVAAGTDEEPQFIILEYRGGDPDAAPLALIGKGITFDSGGISLKPSEKMEQMKYDMSGAAAVLGAMRAVAELRLRVNVVALIPATENLPSGRALKPGDVIGSHAGKTIEVINTDAEGRLILADALSYARRYQPRAVLDAATLTGACVVALGHHAIAVTGNDDALVEEVREAGERAGERCWQLPLWDDYRAQLDSTVADIQNTGGRAAGTITAAWFLREFAGDASWAHLDIAGTAWLDDPPPYLRKGPTGVPARLFLEWVRSRADA